MATLTDPATELAEVAARLEVSSSVVGAKFLAEAFGVDPWSSRFFRIITCILERADQVEHVIQHSSLDQIAKDRSIREIAGFRMAFTGGPLGSNWNTAGNGLTAMSDHGVRLSLLQQTVRPIIHYPKLSEAEVSEFIALIDAYLGELEKNDDDFPFVKQAIRDGLTAFRFQLEYVGWMGSNYVLTAFRAVVEVANESYTFYAAQPNCDPEAMLSSMMGLVTRFKDVVEKVKPYTEAASYAYNAYTLAKPIVMPLLVRTGLLLTGPGG